MKVLNKVLHSVYWKTLNFSKRVVAWILIITFALAFVLTAVQTVRSSHIDSMTVTLNYEGAKQGLNPNGSRFNISQIVSDEVLEKAIVILGDNSLSVEEVRKRITIDAKMPLSAIEKTTEAIASGSNYRYNPSEFDIYYSQKKKIGKNNTVEFIHALSKAYNEYFLEQYSDKNVILEFEGATEFDGYDYYEIYQVLNDKVSSMLSYLGRHQEESPAFRSADTGYTFENLSNMLINLRDQDLEKLSAYVIQNKVSKDTGNFIRKQQYLASKKNMQYNSNMQASSISRDALFMYDPFITGIAFIPSVDQQDEYYMSRTKTGLDNLAMRSYNSGILATNFKKAIDEKNYLVGKYSAGDTTTDAVNEAEKMISGICSNLGKISSVALMTDNEYMAYKTKNYITFALPKDKIVIPIIPFVFNYVINLIFVIAAFRFYYFTPGFIKNKIKAIKNKFYNAVGGE